MAAGCGESGTRMQAYQKDGAVKAMTEGKACLYGTPWRNNVRTVSAIDARDGVGIYYKHCPVPQWGEEANTHVLKEMAAAGCKRIRIAINHGMYINGEWTAPSDDEQKEMDYTFRGCKAAGIRPTATFVHIPAMGTGDAMHTWWHKGWNKGLMPIGKGVPGDEEYDAYFEKVYAGLEAIARSAREAGFTEPGSYDLEMGQNLWWGFPASRPFPGLTEDMVKPGGQVYEFEKALMERLRAAGYNEPTLWWSQSHHLTDRMNDADIPAVCDGGRAISIYSGYSGRTDDGWLGEDAELPIGQPRRAPTDEWPNRPAYTWIHHDPMWNGPAMAGMVISRPESYFADYTRHDNLLAVMAAGRKGLALTSLGVVPSDVPGAMVPEPIEGDVNGRVRMVKAPGVDGWDLKSRGLARALAFWLNQGSAYVLLHSAYEGESDEMSHALIPYMKDPAAFSWKQSQPLRAMHALASAFDGAQKLDKITPLSFRYVLVGDAMLISQSPGTLNRMGPLWASDAVVILPFQVTPTRYAVAVYVMTPNQLSRIDPLPMMLDISAVIAGEVKALVPSRQIEYTMKANVERVRKNAPTSSVCFNVSDDVTMLIFDVQP